MPNRHLTRDGVQVRERNHAAVLQLLHTFGVMRCHDVALAMFPARSPAAAHAAALRALGAGVERGTIAVATCRLTRHTYYALSDTGARWLRTLDPAVEWRSTASMLRRVAQPGHQLAHHQWSTLIALTARARGIEAESEYSLFGRLHGAFERWISRMPDAVTLQAIEGLGDALVWHEVEVSRRSTTASESARRYAERKGARALSGREKLEQLLRRLSKEKSCSVFGEPRVVALALHCATEKIERECSKVIESVFAGQFSMFPSDGQRLYVVANQVKHNLLDAASKDAPFWVYVLRLPGRLADVWADTLDFPLPGDDGALTVTVNETYLTEGRSGN
jgi:hypothetical protein